MDFADPKKRDPGVWSNPVAYAPFAKPERGVARAGSVAGATYPAEGDYFFEGYSPDQVSRLKARVQDSYPGGLPKFSVDAEQARRSAMNGNMRGEDDLRSYIAYLAEKMFGNTQ